MRINVNGTEFAFSDDRITYAELAVLAGHPGAKELTVAYHWRGGGDLKRSGMLIPGQSVVLADGMQFTACYTGNA